MPGGIGNNREGLPVVAVKDETNQEAGLAALVAGLDRDHMLALPGLVLGRYEMIGHVSRGRHLPFAVLNDFLTIDE